VDQSPVDLCHQFGGYDASGVAEQVLWPANFHGSDCNVIERLSPRRYPLAALRAVSDTEKISCYFCFLVSLRFRVLLVKRFDIFRLGVENNGDA